MTAGAADAGAAGKRTHWAAGGADPRRTGETQGRRGGEREERRRGANNEERRGTTPSFRLSLVLAQRHQDHDGNHDTTRATTNVLRDAAP